MKTIHLSIPFVCLLIMLLSHIVNAAFLKKTRKSNASQWQDLPLLVVDNEMESNKNVFGLEGEHALVVPIPERVVVLPVVENFYWKEKRIPLAIVDPIVLDNPTKKGLKELFASLELQGQTVASCYLFARGHAPGIISSAPIDYYMQTRSFQGCQYYAWGLWRLPFSYWEALRKDLIGELGKDRLTLSHGWDIICPELDAQVASTNVLAGNGFSLGGRSVPLVTYEAGTVLHICFTKAGRQTLREALLEEESLEAFRVAEQLARDVRSTMEAKDAAEKAQREQTILQRVREAVAAAPKVPDGKTAGEKRIVKLPRGASMTMVWCPPGSFRMGSPREEAGRQGDETRHWVTLTRGFWMAETEVTQGQWESLMGYNPSSHKNKRKNLPVDRVNWFEAQEFCLNVGLGMQLPTEAQWEYACRAGSEGPYAGTGNLNEMGWFDKNSETRTLWGESSKYMHPAGQKAPNAWGLRDMHGNAQEWCEDVYGEYSDKEFTDPTGAEAGETRVVRSGDFGCQAEACRSACRHVAFPAGKYYGVGFRPVIVGTQRTPGTPGTPGDRPLASDKDEEVDSP